MARTRAQEHAEISFPLIHTRNQARNRRAGGGERSNSNRTKPLQSVGSRKRPSRVRGNPFKSRRKPGLRAAARSRIHSVVLGSSERLKCLTKIAQENEVPDSRSSSVSADGCIVVDRSPFSAPAQTFSGESDSLASLMPNNPPSPACTGLQEALSSIADSGGNSEMALTNAPAFTAPGASILSGDQSQQRKLSDADATAQTHGAGNAKAWESKSFLEPQYQVRLPPMQLRPDLSSGAPLLNNAFYSSWYPPTRTLFPFLSRDAAISLRLCHNPNRDTPLQSSHTQHTRMDQVPSSGESQRVPSLLPLQPPLAFLLSCLSLFSSFLLFSSFEKHRDIECFLGELRIFRLRPTTLTHSTCWIHGSDSTALVRTVALSLGGDNIHDGVIHSGYSIHGWARWLCLSPHLPRPLLPLHPSSSSISSSWCASFDSPRPLVRPC